jgi:D-aspartate ligase
MSRSMETFPPAVILSGNLGPPRKPRSANEIALALSRSLGRRGVRVYRFHPDRSLIDLESRYCTPVRCPNHYDDEPGLIEFLGGFARAQGARPVLYPTSDGACEFISRNEELLARDFSLVCASRSCIAEIQDKGRLLAHARAAGVPIPATFFPRSLEEAEAAAGSLMYPAVIKPLTSYHWKRPEVLAAIGPVKAIQAAGPEELIGAYRKVAPLTPELMLQEIIPGEVNRLLTFLGYFGKDGRALAGCVRKKLRQYPPGFGYCSLTETVKEPEILELSIRLLTCLGYRGIGCVEWKRDPRDGLPKLIEINARAVRTTAAAIGAGIDLPWIAHQDLSTREPPPPEFEYRIPMRWIHLRSEVHAASSLIWKGELRLLEWLRIFRGPRVMAVWAWDDLRPSILDMVEPTLYRLWKLPGLAARALLGKKGRRSKETEDHGTGGDSLRGDARGDHTGSVLSRR